MKGIAFLEVTLTLSLIGIMTCPTSAQTNAIVNGDFETGTLAGWQRDPYGPGGIVNVQSSVNHGGSYALMIDTRTSTSGDYVFQDISFSDLDFSFEFWIFKGSESGNGYVVELIREHEHVSGFAYGVTAVVFWDNTVGFVSWTLTYEHWDWSNYSHSLSSGTWHRVLIEADAISMTQKLFIDGDLVAEQSSSWTYLPEQIVIGDIAGTANHGLFYFDDVVLAPLVPQPPSPVPEFPLGSAMPIAAIPLLLYLWWKRKRELT